MNRSHINALLRQAKEFFAQHRFFLPPFAFWTPQDWLTAGPEASEIVERGLGWDITDFGSGEFSRTGLLLFTLRNGTLEELRRGQGKVYAEKIMVVREGQRTPLHFHWCKTEDIINRGGGILVMRLYPSTREERLGEGTVTVSVDGLLRHVQAGHLVRLEPGQSITLTPGLYHEFWGEGGEVLVGEVSSVNDDQADNRFLEPVGRFPSIREDQPPLHLLVCDYPAYYRHA